jgi:hypothetical protein
MEYLQSYVRDLGGGLVAIGGPNSYGVGGYFETPLEETLPVEMRIRDQERIPQLTMLYVIDRSGSMEMAGPSGISNLELAKEAISRSFDLLNDYDRTGVISFDVDAYFVLELQDVGDGMNREAMRAQVGTLRPGGGTNIRQAVESADTVLRDDPSQLKHIILLTDGGSDPTGIVSNVNDMYENFGITTSVVAIGQNYATWLQDVAVAGRGKFHLAYDVSSIPAIFTAETLIATRSYIFEDEFFPGLSARHPIIAGIDSTPSLLGYVATTPKDTATVILRGPEDDPILAAWQYGLGRSVAFTSDASSRWAANWIGWDRYSDFWSQAIRWTIVEGGTSNVEAQVVQRGEQAVLVVDARDSQGNYLNGLRLDASVVNSQLDRQTLPLQQTAPGRYEAVFTPEREGSYFITVAGSKPATTEGENPETVVQSTGWVLSYSAEYRIDVTGAEQEQPLATLRRITQITGGGMLGKEPEGAFSHDLNQQRAAQPVWQYFVLAALLLLPIDVASRRLIVTRRDLAKVYDLVAEWMGSGPTPAYETTPTSGRLERLRGAKDRARAPSQPSNETPGEPAAVSAPSRISRRRRATPRTAPAPPSPVVQGKAPPAPAAQGGTLASRLLEKRRSSSEDEDKP